MGISGQAQWLARSTSTYGKGNPEPVLQLLSDRKTSESYAHVTMP